MSLDRADLSTVARELSKSMSKPIQGDVIRLKRALRYIRGKPRAFMSYPWQDEQQGISTYVDSDWAGCIKTRRSTSGGMVKLGQHLLCHWSSTQTSVALSSGEAELNAIVKGASEMIGILNMARACGRKVDGAIFTDSSAANSINHRRGCGKIKHLDAKQLWVQDFVLSKAFAVQKLPREYNPADALTHHWLGHEGAKHFSSVGLVWV